MERFEPKPNSSSCPHCLNEESCQAECPGDSDCSYLPDDQKPSTPNSEEQSDDN